MFCFTGLSPEQVAELTEKHHVYLTKVKITSEIFINCYVPILTNYFRMVASQWLVSPRKMLTTWPTLFMKLPSNFTKNETDYSVPIFRSTQKWNYTSILSSYLTLKTPLAARPHL